MKKLILALIVVISGQVLGAPTISVTNPNGGNNGFYATVIEGFVGNPTGSEFWTFCLEKGESFTPNEPLNVVLNTGAIMGGEASGFDPLDVKTAWLYNEFLNGNLLNQSNAQLDVNNGTDMARLQEAIWYLEGESAAPNYLVTYAADNCDWTTIGNIRVMNLTGAVGALRQDMLVRVPAPGALLLGSMGVGLVGWLRRRRTL